MYKTPPGGGEGGLLPAQGLCGYNLVSRDLSTVLISRLDFSFEICICAKGSGNNLIRVMLKIGQTFIL